jgi:hypothetical protein
MKTLFPLLLVSMLLSSCLKDDLDPATLTTNPLDLDYDGTPLVVLDHDTLRIVTDLNGFPIDTVLEQNVRVRTDLLPPLTGWTWTVKDLTTGVVTNTTNNSPEYTSTVYHPVIGSTHCYEYILQVQYSPTKPYSYCSVAAW